MVFRDSDDATPQIPPIATPYSTLKTRKIVNDGAAADSSSKIEKDDIQHQDRLTAIFLGEPAKNETP